MRQFVIFVLILAGVASGRPQAKVSQQAVILTWTAPSSSPDPVAGYDAFRAPSGGTSYQQINSLEIPAAVTTYTDAGPLTSGATYNYIVESVDASGVDSGPTNTAVVPIPTWNPPTVLAAPTVVIKP
jgi:hypothetical protein